MSILIKFRKTVMFAVKLLITLTITFGFVFVWQRGYPESLFMDDGNYVVVFAFLFILLTFIKLYGGFKIGVFRMHELWYSLGIAIVFTNFIMYMILSLIAREMLLPWWILGGTVFQIILTGINVYAANSIYFSLYSSRHILAIYSGDEHGRETIRKMSCIPERYTIDKALSIRNRSMKNIKREIDKYKAVLICDFDQTKKDDVLRYCYEKRKRIYLLPSSTDIILSSAYQSQVFDTPILMCRNYGLTMEQLVVKRAMDIIVSLIMLICASPIMLITAIAIKLCDGGPVFFKQNRVTRDGEIFNVLKFRSMIVDADKDGVRGASNNDSRITPVGKIIRACRVDELPQLINVLRGDMSLVGPRPERTENVYTYTEKYPDFNLRHRVKGGLTGYAQIYGKYNTSPEDKLNMDLIYIEKYSTFLDIKLLFMTFKILFMKESTEGFEEKPKETNQEKGKESK
ncbi:MAG: sugar transferase [Clostridia bacterium]|nr:sugar transferase [Oscillospiraceae bacterium]MBR6693690.1 sugar transferase [Clostridia bacterium]